MPHRVRDTRNLPRRSAKNRYKFAGNRSHRDNAKNIAALPHFVVPTQWISLQGSRGIIPAPVL
jgi:hypothetical protein